MRFNVFGLASALVAIAAVANAQVTTPPAPQPAPVAAPAVKCDQACLQAKIDRHLALIGEQGTEEALQASMKELRDAGAAAKDLRAGGGPSPARLARDTYNQWSRAEAPDPQTGETPGELRWRAVHLLGSLGDPEAIPTLFAIARKPLPEPQPNEKQFAQEYRIRLRAIAGLEKLKAVDELKELYEIGGVLRNPVAASLFELGVNVGNVRRVEAREGLLKEAADQKDYHPSKGRPPQPEKPGSAKATEMKRRPDTPTVRKAQ